MNKSNRANNLKKNFWWLFWALLIITLYGWAILGMNFTKIQASAGEVTRSMLNGLIHPDWNYVFKAGGDNLISELITTLAIAYLGTLIATFFSIPIGFLVAKNSHKKHNWISKITTFILVAIRSFPEIILAVMFIKVVGPGCFAGVLAMGIHSIGMLGKLFSESIETISQKGLEAFNAAGATKLQGFWGATLPVVMPSIISNCLYSFEIAVRSASILGLVGAGGIGTPLMMALTTRNWSRVGIILIGIVLVVMVIDFISEKIRNKLV